MVNVVTASTTTPPGVVVEIVEVEEPVVVTWTGDVVETPIVIDMLV